MKKPPTYKVTPVPGQPHVYDVARVGGSPHRVNLNQLLGRGVCDCPGYLNHVQRTRKLENCAHIRAARNFDQQLPKFSPDY